jgi:predicted MFS family arabinose efflux permease
VPDEDGAARLILILAVCGFASTFASRSVEPLIGVIARDLRSDPQTTALIATAFTLPYAFIQPILGPIGDALGKERVVKVCLGALTAALFASAFTNDLVTLSALRVAAGAAAGGIVPSALALIGDRVAMARRQVAISRFMVAIILGQLAGSSIAGFLANLIGWRGVFVLSAGLALAACLASVFGFGPPVRTPRPLDARAALLRYRAIIRNPRARALFALVFVEALIFFGIGPFIAPVLEARGDGGPFEAGLVLASLAIGGLAYSVLIAWMLRHWGIGLMLPIAGALSAAAFVTIGWAGAWQIDALAMMVLGFSFYVLHTSFQTQVTELAPEARASAVALHAFSFFVGQALGVAAIGVAIGAIGWGWTLIVCALVAIALGVTAAVVILSPQPRAR